jgi:DNA-binding NarL/FixJ family response regulator
MFEKKYRQISEIEAAYRAQKNAMNDVNKRRLIPIAVIDDEPFVAEQTLKNNGYDIHVLGDISSIEQITPFNIILCDLQGVGKHLNSKNQGAYIIDEIKRNHPDKFVIAYTGGAKDDSVTLHAQKFADFFLSKDTSVEEWRDKLDSIITFLSNPVKVWKRQRYALIEADVPTLDILKLEDAYVQSVVSKKDDKYRSIVESYAVGADIRSIAQSLVASGIFKLISG